MTEIISLIESGRLAEAEDRALAWVAGDAGDSEAWSILTILAAQRGDLSEAIDRSDRTLALAPRDERAWLNRGNLERLRQNPGEATRAYQQVLEIVPGHDAAEFNLAVLAEEEERWTEAEARYRSILGRRPDHAETLYNLARLLASDPLLRETEAADLYALAIEASPFHLDSWRNRAHLLRRLERDEEAIGAYERILEIDPADATSRHILAALRGANRPTADPEYVVRLFDRFAATYDRDFEERLGYEAATRLTTDLLEVGGDLFSRRSGLRVLDLGCGTGLFLEQLRLQTGAAVGSAKAEDTAKAAELRIEATGVDLSREMLARAEARGLYENLVAAEAVEWMQEGSSQFDLVALVDVLIYIGDPEGLLLSTRPRLVPGGLLACTAELARDDKADPPDVEPCVQVLQRTGRFAHREEPLRRALAKSGFEIVSWKRAPLRRERGEVVEGIYVIARRGSGSIGDPR